MTIITQKKEFVEVDRVCDVCQDGRYRPEPVALLSSPPKYPHVCDNCFDKKNFSVRFPTTIAVNAGDDIDQDSGIFKSV